MSTSEIIMAIINAAAIIIGDNIAQVLLTIINKFLVVLMYMFLKVSFFISVLF